MPELPEVEVARRALVRWFEGRTLVKAEAEPTRTFREEADREAFTQLTGKVVRLDRRGKYLLVAFDTGQGFVGHLGMTGKWLRRPVGVAERWSRARLHLDSGEVLHFQDPRMFGHLHPMAASALDGAKAVAKLGRDPLVDGLNAAQLQEALGSSRQDLKVALMDQERLAGLGNIHAAEALFRSKLHPSRLPGSLSQEEWARLTDGIHAALQYALDHEQGDEIQYVEEPGAPNPFLIYGRAGEACSVCGTTVVSFEQGGRTTHVCPHCQPAGKAPRGTKRAQKAGKASRAATNAARAAANSAGAGARSGGSPTKAANKAPRPATKAPPPATKAPPPATKGSRPATKASRPATKASLPANKASLPANKASRPANKASRPASKASRPASKASRPATKASRSASTSSGKSPSTAAARRTPRSTR